MKGIRSILPFLIPQWPKMLISILANLMSAVFSVISITMIIPFMGILFLNHPVIPKPESFHFSATAIRDILYYYLGEIIQEKGIVSALMLIIILIVGFTLLRSVFSYVSRIIITGVRIRFVKDLRDELLNSMLIQDLDYFSEERRGDISSRLSFDVKEVESSIIKSFELLFKEPILIIVYLIVLFKLNMTLSIYALIILPVSVFAIGMLGRAIRNMSFRNQEKLGHLMSIFDEIFTAIKIIKASTAEDIARQKFQDGNREYSNLFYRIWKRRSLGPPINDFIMVVSVIVVLWFGIKLTFDPVQNFSSQSFIGFMAVLLQLFGPTKSFSSAFMNIQKGLASLIRINEVMLAQPDITNIENPKLFDKFESKIEFRNVSYARPDKIILHDVSFEINKGETIAFVGHSGGGKTTLVDLIPRFLEATSGNIFIDNDSIRNYRIDILRQKIGYVNQVPLLFDDTIYNNIVLGNENYKEEDVIHAAELAYAHEFIMSKKLKYKAPVGEGGQNLSLGERQRISIARAILKDPPIMILDEATSSLDTESETAVREAIKNLMKTRTTVIIAHRISTVTHVDRIYVIHDGQIIEKGNHSELMKFNGTYRKLYDLQLL